MFFDAINQAGVIPVHPANAGGGGSTNGIFDPLNPEWTEWNYSSDYGTNNSFWSDSSSYFGDYGNYDNGSDVFDGYSGVDSGTTTTATTPHETPSSPPSTSYLVYSQSSGNIFKVVDGIGTMIGTGYSGDQTYHNIPEAQSYKSEGPIPQGEYEITQVDNHKGPKTISLSPSESNDMFGRDNFLIHGDNKAQNYTASEGCIILDANARTTVINSGITKLIVTR